MPWINDTPHSIGSAGGGKGSAAKRLGVAAKKKAPKVNPYEAARKRLKAGEKMLFTRPKSWTWEKSGARVAAGTISTLKAFDCLIELEPGLFPGNPGQVWGWNEAKNED